LNAHYADALRLAEVVLRGSAFGPAPGAVPARGFVLDMDVVFETFVCAALGEALRARVVGAWARQPRMHLDVAGRVEIKPDFAFRVAGRPVAIADAKYKAGFERRRDDLYQMVAYCAALGVPRGHLVYAASPTGRLVHEVRRGGVQVVQHALDLDAPPAELLAAVDRLADELAADIPEPIRTIPAGGRP
jgi:5-methylcytosine-specific restriction enzyme subunit McrC